MIKRLSRRFISWAMREEESVVVSDHYNTKMANTGINIVRNTNGLEDSSGMNFTLYNAKGGGHIVQVVQYDHLMDKRHTALYIISNEDNFGDELANILVRERLSR
jgi:pyruvate/oxaloacetate carboxyltransferase